MKRWTAILIALLALAFLVTCGKDTKRILDNPSDPESDQYIGHEIRDPADPINVPSVDIIDAPTVIRINREYTYVATATDSNPAGRSTGEIVRWDWSFGDGTTLEDGSPSVQHTYATTGTFTVRVTVTDNDGNNASCTAKVAVHRGLQPAINASGPYTTKINRELTLVGTASDADGVIVKYEWDFEGDGTYDWSSTTTGKTQRTFTAVGEYTAVFRVTDDDGNVVTCSTTVRVYDEGIEIEGVITTTIWTSVNSPYCVTGTVTIPSGNVLTIEGGVDVLFDADVQFIVQGAIHAYGTETDSVRFLKGSSVLWRGIRISGGDSSSFAYTRISDGNARGNSPDDYGGGLYVTGSGTHVSLTNCTINANTAYYGGGIYNYNAIATFRNCTVSGNTAPSGGGIYNAYFVTATLTNCTISGNIASDYGGGIYNLNEVIATLTNCTISENTASFGGGVYTHNDAIATLTNCTIFRNTASNSGGGIYSYYYATTTLTNCILWQNSARIGPQIRHFSETVPARYSNIQDGLPVRVTDTRGNINADPLFVDAGNGDFRLSAGSPCIDAGDPASPKDPDGTRADMGAIPYQH